MLNLTKTHLKAVLVSICALSLVYDPAPIEHNPFKTKPVAAEEMSTGNNLPTTPDIAQLAQDLLRRRDAETIQEETPPEEVTPEQPPKEQPTPSEAQKLPKRREAEELPETIPPLQEEEAFIPDLFIPTPDRWRLPGYKRNVINPYRQNVLKGDYPIFGQDIFFIFTGISDTLFEFRQLPTPVGVSTARPGEAAFFGKDNQLFIRENIFLRFELVKGDTAFKPPDWAIVATPAFNVPSYLKVQERGIVNADVTEGTSRTTFDFAMQELFAEYHLHNISHRYDFISTKVGIQPFNSDFRGFIFIDSNLGARLFGDFDNNRWQYNLLFFEMLEKDTNSEFNTFNLRDQEVVIANLYRQDFIWLGYTTQFSIIYNHDNGGIEFDNNDFLVRPDPVGDAKPHTIDVVYLGWTSDGHIGPLNINHALYLAFGRDDRNPLAGREVNIFGQMAALELSMDFDWMRPKVSFFYSSGDGHATDGYAGGFDTILDRPNFVGGGFSFWNRQRIPLLGVGLVQRESLIPNLRSSKIEGQVNFVNPGIFIANAGLDVETTPKLKTFLNANYLRFNDTEPLEVFLQQPDIGNNIGFDLSLGFFYRPLLNNNIIITGGVAALIPGDGFKDILTSSVLFQGFVDLILTY